MMTEDKLNYYVIYAIGEVVLVVLGILIALQIDKWNEALNLRKKEVALLTEMKTNLEADLADIHFNIRLNKEAQKANEVVLENLTRPGIYNDTLSFYYANLMGGAYTINNTSAYDNLKSLGFHIINNDSLRIMITELYSMRYPYIDKLESNYMDNFYTTKLEPLLITHLVTDSVWLSSRPVNQIQLAMNHEFNETIKINAFWIRFMVDEYAIIEEKIAALIHQIEAEVNQE